MFYCWVTKGAHIYLVAMRPGDTHVPIPNTVVKAWAADGTMLVTAWESRWLPDFKKKEDIDAGLAVCGGRQGTACGYRRAAQLAGMPGSYCGMWLYLENCILNKSLYIKDI